MFIKATWRRHLLSGWWRSKNAPLTLGLILAAAVAALATLAAAADDTTSTIPGPGAELLGAQFKEMGATSAWPYTATATQVVAASDSESPGIAGSDEIQAAIDALPGGGGLVQLLEGTFSITGSISVPSDVTIQGMGPATVLDLDFDGHIFVNSAEDVRRITMRNFRVDGNDRDFYAIYFDQGASLLYDPDHVFEHLYIERLNAIYHRGNLGNMRLYDVKSLGARGYAFALYSPDNILIACEAGKRVYHTHHPKQGFHIIGKTWLLGSTAYASDTGIYVTGEGNIINSVVTELNQNQGVYLEDAVGTYITQLHSRKNSSLSPGSEPDIKMVGASLRNRITDSYFDGSNQTGYNIEESPDSDYNVMEGNYFHNALFGPVLRQGPNTVVR